MTKARELAELSRTIIDTSDATAITINADEEVTLADDLFLADGKKAVFGAGSDLQIYHDGNNSYIEESGDGDLIITSPIIRPRTDQFTLNNAANTEHLVTAAEGGSVALYYDAVKKLETDSSGVSISGVLTVIDGSTSAPSISNAGDSNSGIYFPADDELGFLVGGSRKIHITSSGVEVENGSLSSGAMDITASGNNLTLKRSSFDDIVFGIGTVSSIDGLHITNNTDNKTFISIHENAPASSIVLDSGGNLGIGAASASARLEVTGAFAYASGANSLATTVSKAAARIRGSSDASTSLFFGSLSNDAEQYIQSSNGAGTGADDLVLNPYGGNVGIGTAPATKFDVMTTGVNQWYIRNSDSSAQNNAIVSLRTGGYSNIALDGATVDLKIAGSSKVHLDSSGNTTFAGTISSGAITSTAAVSADHYTFAQNSSASGVTESIHRNTTGQITIRASSEDLVRVDGANEIVQIGGLPAGNVQTHGVVATNKVRATLGNTINDTMRVFAVHGQTANSDFLTFRARRITDGQSGWNHAVWDISRDIDNTSNLYEYLTFGIGELTVNDLSNNLDFRVESNSHAHALYVNGGNNSVGINSSNPDGALTVSGTSTSGDMIARFQHGTNGNNIKGIRVNAPNASGTQAYADFAVDPETGNLGIGAGTSSGNLPIGQANMANAAIVITSPAGAAGAGEAIDFQPGESHTRTTVREQHHFGASDVYVQFRRFMYTSSAFTNPTKNIITFTRSGSYPQACVYARVRQMGVSVNRAVIAEGFISVEKDSGASSWDVDYATMSSGTTGYSSTTNSFWPIARINTSVSPTWYTSISGDSITVGITMTRSTNYDRYIIETEVMTHQHMSYSWEA